MVFVAGTMTVVLGPGWPGVLLHEAIGHGLEGDFNRKGTSAFSNRIGERVASEHCTVVDDGTLSSRRGNDMTTTYPSVAAAVAKQPANTLILDGEIVAFDERGVPSFERLQSRINLTNPVEIRQAERDLPAERTLAAE